MFLGRANSPGERTVAANFRTSLVGGFFFTLFLVWRLDCALFTFHLDGGQSTCHVSLLFLRKKLEFNYGSSVSRFPDKGGTICCSFLSFWVGFQESAIKAVN